MRTKTKEFTAMIVGRLDAEEKQWKTDAERKWRLCNEYFDCKLKTKGWII